jgi:hypothetical protein
VAEPVRIALSGALLVLTVGCLRTPKCARKIACRCKARRCGVDATGQPRGEFLEQPAVPVRIELQLCVAAQKMLADKGIRASVVSMPCVEWFESQPAEYRDRVLPPAASARVAVEAAVAQSWYKLVGDTGEIVSIEHYGASADYKTLFHEFGFTPETVVAAAERSLNNRQKGQHR